MNSVLLDITSSSANIQFYSTPWYTKSEESNQFTVEVTGKHCLDSISNDLILKVNDNKKYNGMGYMGCNGYVPCQVYLHIHKHIHTYIHKHIYKQKLIKYQPIFYIPCQVCIRNKYSTCKRVESCNKLFRSFEMHFVVVNNFFVPVPDFCFKNCTNLVLIPQLLSQLFHNFFSLFTNGVIGRNEIKTIYYQWFLKLKTK